MLISILSIYLSQRSHLLTLSLDILIFRTVPSSFDLKSFFTKVCILCELLFSQDPVLFSGTFRLNLDPFNNYSDEELWNVVEVTQLKTFITAHDKGLHLPILEGGENMR